jgi:SAM-dependent methyltransferase
MSQAEVSAYEAAVASGRYARVTGLEGKYDNVRVHWEEQSLGIMLRAHLERLVARRRREGRLLRILDLGCGSGDGFDALMSIKRQDVPWQEDAVELISPEVLGHYTGVELNPALLEQARERYSRMENVSFLEADLRDGLPFGSDEQPFDVYFASFGTFSHLGEEETIRLLSDIARHADDGAIVVADWLGRYAYEWTDLWEMDTSREHWMDYRISYIYSEEERETRTVDSFPLRLLSRGEALRVFERAEEETGVSLTQRSLFDRSLFVGRHMDTAEYNRNAVPLRSAVNRLHETGCRTDLDTLRFELHVPESFREPCDVLRRVHAGWSAVVRYTADALARADAAEPLPEIPPGMSDSVRAAMDALRTAIEARDAIGADDPRADWIEPHLGLALRNIELSEQRGVGCGHGLVAVYEVGTR